MLTKEMSARDELDNRYERAIYHQISPEIQVIKVHIDIDEVYRFEVFFQPIMQVIQRIQNENPKTRILANLSSGTAQFMGALTMYIQDIQNDIIPIQVMTPVKGANQSEVVKRHYEFEDELALNIDNEVPFEDRTIEPDLSFYKRIMVKAQVRKLIEHYDYHAALALLKQYQLNAHHLNTLLHFADARIKLQGPSINEKLTIFKDSDMQFIKYYPVKKANYQRIPDWYTLIEYFCVAKTRSETDDLATYCLMMEPLAIKIYERVLDKCLKQSPRHIFDIRRQGDREYLYLDPDKLDVSLKKFIESCFSRHFKNFNGINEGYVSDKVMMYTIKYYLSLHPNQSLESDIKALSECFDRLKPLRNAIAHNLISVTREQFLQEVKITPEQLNRQIEIFIQTHFDDEGFNPNMFTIYAQINERIVALMEGLL